MRQIALIFTLLVVFFLSCYPISDYDEGWHVKLGEYVYQHGELPYKDPLSFTASDRNAPIYSIAFDIIVYPIYHAFGFKGLILFRATLVALLFGILFFLADFLNPKWLWVNVLCLLILYATLRVRFPVRPLVFSQICFASTYLFLLRHIRWQKRRDLLIAGGLTLLNANLHVEWFLTGSLWIVLACNKIIRAKGSTLFARLFNIYTRSGFLVLGVILLSTLVSPMARQGVWEFPRLIFDHSRTYSQIYIEMQPLHVAAKYYHFFAYSLLVVFAWGFWVFQAKREHLDKETSYFMLMPLWGFPLTFLSARNYPYAAIAFLPLLVITGARLAQYFAHRVKAVYLKPLMGSLLVASVLLCNSHPGFTIGFGLNKNLYSETGLNFIKTHLPPGNMYNELSFGGILALYLHPEKKVFMDGRSSVFPATFYQDPYLRIMNGEADWQQKLQHYNIDFCVLRSERSGLALQLLADPHWAFMFWDPVMMVFFKKTPENGDILETFEYRLFNPFDLTKFNKTHDGRKSQEVARLLRDVPDDPFIHHLAAQEFVDQRNWQKAIFQYQKLIELEAKEYYPETQLGIIFATLQDWQRAETFFRMGVENHPRDAYPAQQLNHFYQLTGSGS